MGPPSSIVTLDLGAIRLFESGTSYAAVASQSQAILSIPEPSPSDPRRHLYQLHSGQPPGLRFSPGTRADGVGSTW